VAEPAKPGDPMSASLHPCGKSAQAVPATGRSIETKQKHFANVLWGGLILDTFIKKSRTQLSVRQGFAKCSDISRSMIPRNSHSSTPEFVMKNTDEDWLAATFEPPVANQSLQSHPMHADFVGR
jgi:hypothetical protein